MVTFDISLTFRTAIRLLILAGFAAASLQTADIGAQDSPRSGRSQGDDVSRNRDDRDRVENRQGFPEDDRRGRFAFSGGNRRPGFNREDRKPQPKFFREGEFEGQPTNEGFVFVNGEFLPSPYVFRASGKQTFVNDVMIAEELLSVDSRLDRDGDEEGYGRGGRRRSQETQQTYAEYLFESFSQSRQVMMVFDGQSPALLSRTAGGNDLLSVLVSDAHRSELLPRVLANAGSSVVASKWSDWVQSFRPSQEFLASAKPIVDRIKATVGEDQARHAAMKRLDSFAYPLTITGMIMSVFAIGHLVSNPPNGGKTPDEIEMSPEVVKIVTRSIILVVALSLLDLIWTLLASQAGTMRELNPVGGRLIDDPAKLIAFKVAMTGLAAGLIFKLRYYRRAQLASWWACLILTLLTVRWLTFNSMLA